MPEHIPKSTGEYVDKPNKFHHNPPKCLVSPHTIVEQDSKPTQPISWVFHFSTAKTHGPIFTQNSPNDMLPAKEVPFGVTKK